MWVPCDLIIGKVECVLWPTLDGGIVLALESYPKAKGQTPKQISNVWPLVLSVKA